MHDLQNIGQYMLTGKLNFRKMEFQRRVAYPSSTRGQLLVICVFKVDIQYLTVLLAGVSYRR
jgi:hypothetical protein